MSGDDACINYLKTEREALAAKLQAVRDAWKQWQNVEWADEAADRRFDKALRAAL